jgi:hypothetical protein
VTFCETKYQRGRVHWLQAVWYGQQKDLFALKDPRPRAIHAERAASETILPSLGFTGLIDLTAIIFNAPFDFVAFKNNERVAVEVSSKWQKRVETKAQLAAALGLDLYLVLVSPRDQRFFHCTKLSPTAKTSRVPFSLLRCMADFFGDDHQ